MKKIISKNKFFSAICAFGLVLMLGCAMALSACTGGIYTTGELKLAKGKAYGVSLDSTVLTATNVASSIISENDDTEDDDTVYDYAIKITGAVAELSNKDYSTLFGDLPHNEKGKLVVMFTLSITQEMVDDEDAKLYLDNSEGTRKKICTLSEEIDIFPDQNNDGVVIIVFNTAGDGVSHMALEWTPEGATDPTVINYIIDFTEITNADTPAEE